MRTVATLGVVVFPGFVVFLFLILRRVLVPLFLLLLLQLLLLVVVLLLHSPQLLFVPLIELLLLPLVGSLLTLPLAFQLLLLLELLAILILLGVLLLQLLLTVIHPAIPRSAAVIRRLTRLVARIAATWRATVVAGVCGTVVCIPATAAVVVDAVRTWPRR